MKTASLVLGVLGGFLVLVGLVLYAYGEIATSGGWAEVSGQKLLTAGVMTAGLTIAPWVGIGIISGKMRGRPFVGVGLMAIGVIGLVSVVGLKAISLLAMAALGLSAVLGIWALRGR